MKTLEQIKNDYAVSVGFRDWYHLSINYTDYDKHWTNICILAQKQALQNASENAEAETNTWGDGYCIAHVVSESITNENNLVK